MTMMAESPPVFVKGSRPQSLSQVLIGWLYPVAVKYIFLLCYVLILGLRSTIQKIVYLDTARPTVFLVHPFVKMRIDCSFARVDISPLCLDFI